MSSRSHIMPFPIADYPTLNTLSRALNCIITHRLLERGNDERREPSAPGFEEIEADNGL